MGVSVLMLVGILLYRWVTGEPPEKGTGQGSSPVGAQKEAGAGSESPGSAPGKEGATEVSGKMGRGDPEQPSMKAVEPTKKAEPLDVSDVTDGKVLTHRFRLALDRGDIKAGTIIFRQGVTHAGGNPELLALVEEALSAWWTHTEDASALVSEVELAVKRVQVTPNMGGFERAFGQVAMAVLGNAPAGAVGAALQRAEQAATTELQRGQVSTWRCALAVRQEPRVMASPACVQAVQRRGDHLAYFFAAQLAGRQPATAVDAGAMLERALKLEPLFRPAMEALADLHERAKKNQDAHRVLVDGAKALAEKGFHRGALQLFKRARSVLPGDADGWIGAAQSHEAMDEIKEALSAYRKAATLAKGEIQVRLSLARLLEEEDLLGAIKILVEAEEIDPGSAVVKQALARAREKLASHRPEKEEETLTVVDGKRMRVVFTSAGGVPRAIALKQKKYKERGDVKGPELRAIKEGKLEKQVNLVRTWSEFWLPLRISFVRPSFPAPSWIAAQAWAPLRWDGATKSYGLVKKGEEHAVREGGKWRVGYRWPVEYEGMAPPPVVVERSYVLDPDNAYHWEMEIRVINRSVDKQFAQLEMRVPSYDHLEEDRSFFNPISLKKEAICLVGDKVQMQTLPTLFQSGSGCMGCDASTCACRRTPAKGTVSQGEIVPGEHKGEKVPDQLKDRAMSFTGRVQWVGIDEMYFLLAVALQEKGDSTCTLSGWKDPGAPRKGVLLSRLVLPGRELPHKDAVLTHRFTIFSGPKISEELERVRVGGSNPKLSEAIDYGFFWFIGQPMIFVMKKIYVFAANWGLAIILLTLLIKLLTLPLTMKQMRSMKGMAKLKPEMDKLKEKYGDDKQRFQQEMWSLYKAHKINPLGGCLPLLIQMPIYIAWYQALMVSVDLYNAPLFGWIHDLTKPDSVQIFGFGVPILPLLMGATMFLQQRMTPTTVDSTQQKMMMYMMPAMFTFFMLFLPSGLTLYILTNTLLTMAHQWYMNNAD